MHTACLWQILHSCPRHETVSRCSRLHHEPADALRMDLAGEAFAQLNLLRICLGACCLELVVVLSCRHMLQGPGTSDQKIARQQEEGIGSKVGAGFKNLLGSNKGSAGQPASAGAAEPGSQKAGRFASLRAKMTKSNDTSKVNSQTCLTHCQSSLLLHACAQRQTTHFTPANPNYSHQHGHASD